MTRAPLARSLVYCHHLTLETMQRQIPIEQIYAEKLTTSAAQGSTAMPEQPSTPVRKHTQNPHTQVQPHTRTTQKASIAIVGAGMAGLNAALTLQDGGFSSIVYEASDRVGGRMHSDTTSWADGMVTEWCGEFIDSDDETLHRLIARFGLPTSNLAQTLAPDAQRITYLLNHYQSVEQLNRAFQAISPILQQHAQEAGFPTTHTRSTDKGYELDQMSVYEWIERYVEGGHTSPPGRMLDIACNGFYGLEADDQSALNLVYMFGSQVPGSPSVSTGPLWGSAKIVGGNQQLPLAIARSLPVASIQLHHRLTSIMLNSSGKVILTFATPTGIITAAYDAVILTLPFNILRQLDYQRAGFDSLKKTAITELGYGTISKLFLQFDRPYWFEDGPWPRPNNGFIMTDLDIRVLWDATLGQSGTHGILVSYMGGQRGASYQPSAPYSTTTDSPTVQRYAQRSLELLEQVFPGISEHYCGTATLSYPTGDPYLQGSYSCWRIGQYTRFAGYEGVRQGPIHFAGEHCSVLKQGFMEGAAQEGARAAHEILQDYGLA